MLLAFLCILFILTSCFNDDTKYYSINDRWQVSNYSKIDYDNPDGIIYEFKYIDQTEYSFTIAYKIIKKPVQEEYCVWFDVFEGSNYIMVNEKKYFPEIDAQAAYRVPLFEEETTVTFYLDFKLSDKYKSDKMYNGIGYFCCSITPIKYRIWIKFKRK